MKPAVALLETESPVEKLTADVKSARQSYAGVHGGGGEEELVERHLPLVKTIVGRLAMSLPPHVDSDDLYSAGLVGLLNAVRNFDSQGGSTFESYARVRIRGAIFDELRRLDWVPRSVHEKARKVQKVMQTLEQSKGDAPTDLEMASAMHLSLNAYEQLLEEIRPATFVCLDRTGPDDEATAHDLIQDPGQENPREQASRRELSELIAARLRRLPDMQQKVLALYYHEGLRLREIAEVYGVTESRICQVHSQAILTIKAFLQREDRDFEAAAVIGRAKRFT